MTSLSAEVALPGLSAADRADREERIRTLSTYLTVLLGLLVSGSLFYAVVEGISLDVIFALIGDAAGFRFVALARRQLVSGSAATRKSMRTMFSAFVALWVMSLLTTLIIWRGFDPIELLGIGMFVVSVYLMLQVRSDAERLSVPAQVASTPHAVASSSADIGVTTPKTNAPATEVLRDLAQLRDAGVLTEEEFRAKKEELLRRI